ncbi:rhodanese-like domain-containing protein [Blautia producta]|uniref:rhodanese-like domain-containing protein n=1 Tax=Blautia producta TaxID=33035 RepID=UPI0035BE7D23
MKKNKKWLFAVIAAGVLTAALSACGQDKTGQDTKAAQEDTVKAEYKKITAEEAKERMDKDDKVVILDVRTEEEYQEGHVPGAIVIPNETISSEPLEELPDMDQEILVYCRSGNRSAQAAKKARRGGIYSGL